MSGAVVNPLRKPPPPAAFFTPEGLTDFSFLQLLVSVAGDLLVSVNCRLPRYQRRNVRCLIRRIRVLLVLFEFLLESRRPFPSLAELCFKEFYIVVSRARILLDYCSQSSRLWLLLRNQEISGYFHDLEREICTLLDVLPLAELLLSADMREQVELLRRQVGSSRMYFDDGDEQLRVKLLSILSEIDKGRMPDNSDMKSIFIDRIGMLDAGDFDSEIKFLENQICNQEDDAEVDQASVGGIVAVVRYCRFSLFGCRRSGGGKSRSSLRSSPSSDDISAISIPTDFCCPISLELMREPVVVLTGQTYDRKSITQWIASGHRTCPNSGQILVSASLILNCALNSLISHWCTTNGVPCDSQGNSTGGSGGPAASKAEVEANRATIRILIRNLSDGEDDSKATAAYELRMLAKTGKENRAIIANENAIPLLCCLLRSPNPTAQENAVTALLNLSILEANKMKIVTQPGCLSSIIRVLRRGLTPAARENAAAALFSLSSIHDYKKRITDEPSGIEALARLLRKGTARGRKDAAKALFNLSTHPENWERMVVSGAVAALVGAVGDEEVAEEAAGALALLARQPVVAGMVGWEDRAVVGLAGVMSGGTARGRENAAAALHEICRRGGAEVAERVARVPGVAVVVQTVAIAGTKRARRKAAELARMLERREFVSLSLAPAGFRGAGWLMEQVSPVAVPVTVL